jgi:sugar lactone lactonase YvrE
MAELQTLLTGLAFGESPRWHDGRLWLADWGSQEVHAVDLDGSSEVILRVPIARPQARLDRGGRLAGPAAAPAGHGVLAGCMTHRRDQAAAARAPAIPGGAVIGAVPGGVLGN